MSRMEISDPERAWTGKNFDESRIFAQIDAFMQRCRDLLEVCESQHQFTSNPDDNPTFSGARGEEISKSLVRIQTSFQRLIANISSSGYGLGFMCSYALVQLVDVSAPTESDTREITAGAWIGLTGQSSPLKIERRPEAVTEA